MTARRWLAEQGALAGGGGVNVQRRGPDLALWRSQVIAVASCPICGSDVTTPCQGRGGGRQQPHAERIDRARRDPRWERLAPLCEPDCPSCEGTGWVEIERNTVDACPRRRRSI